MFAVYYCIHCQEVHEVVHIQDVVFKTGYRRMPNGDDVSLGLCALRRPWPADMPDSIHNQGSNETPDLELDI